MPNYALDHLHHETENVDAAVDFYKKLFNATAEDPFARGGATWVRVHIGDVRVMVSDRECTGMELGRYQGYDHPGLTTDDFDATLAAIEEHGFSIWVGPQKLDTGQRMLFVNGPDDIKIEILEKA